jgi:cell division protein ZapA
VPQVPDARVIHVEVHGQRYPIRTALDDRYVHELAAFVDRKMRAASDASPATDIVGLAVLTALNIADEYFRARDQRSSETQTFASRTSELERIVDEALQIAGQPD